MSLPLNLNIEAIKEHFMEIKRGLHTDEEMKQLYLYPWVMMPEHHEMVTNDEYSGLVYEVAGDYPPEVLANPEIKLALDVYRAHWDRDLQDLYALLFPLDFTDSSNNDILDSSKETLRLGANSSLTPENEQTKVSAVQEELHNKYYQSWDPRLQRLDEFMLRRGGDGTEAVRIPFSSLTAATAFYDLVWTTELGVAQLLVNNDKVKSLSIAKYLKAAGEDPTKDSVESEKSSASMTTGNIRGEYDRMDVFDKVVMDDTAPYENNNNNWGVQSIVNPYSLTKLMGGLEMSNGEPVENFMYDIRDKRRFYGLSVDSDDVLAVSNPTVTQLVEYGNADKWGRTPYSFQDFVYCKYFGLIPNNRLITFRRYAAPTYDNLQFENMFGNTTNKTKNSNGTTSTESTNEMTAENANNKVFSPHASVVTWFGGDTGNQLSTLMSFSTGIKWGEVKSEIYNTTGNEGETKQSVIDKLLDNGLHRLLYHGAENSKIDKLLEGGSMATAAITSFGKFALSINGSIGMDQQTFEHLSAANVDPYSNNFSNRVLGPINRIDAVKKRDAGIEFSQTLTIKCAYKSKAIGGINPKAAMLDVLGNCMEMVSPHAVFWGGGHRFMVMPLLYPWHDSGWRDSFMARIYDGKFLGDDGAIATILSGVKKVGNTEDGKWNWDNMKSILGNIGGDAFGIIGAAISNISNMFGGFSFLDSIANMASQTGADMSNRSKESLIEEGKEHISKFYSNILTLWHNRMMVSTILPKIDGAKALLVGEPVGEWHLTVGNPLNPIMVIGNLVCSKMDVKWDEELGPDDFPTGFEVTYTIEHGMARDYDAIQSMFNRGMGKYYTLPDYMQTSSDRMTYVDRFTKDAGTGDTGAIKYKKSGTIMQEMNAYGYQTYRISGGTTPKMHGNPNTQLITKFTPLNAMASTTLATKDLRAGNGGSTAIVKSLAATRKKS